MFFIDLFSPLKPFDGWKVPEKQGFVKGLQHLFFRTNPFFVSRYAIHFTHSCKEAAMHAAMAQAASLVMRIN